VSDREPWQDQPNTPPRRDWRHWPPSSGHGAWGHGSAHWGHNWPQHRRRIFLRFAIGFSILILVASGVISFLTFHFTGNVGDGEYNGPPVWIWLRCLAVLLPVIAVGAGLRAFRSVATPLAEIMDAADAVAGGNLHVSVQERGSREFRQLARSFNRMSAELARTDEQRRNLAADVAHELRTPLHIIQGNLEGILDGVYQATPEHIEATLDETRLLARLVEDLRTLSLAESGQLPLRRERVDVGDLLADVTTSFSGQAEAAGIELRVENGTTESLTIQGDAGRLDQVLSNLVSNAIRHTPQGGRITLRARTVDGFVQMTIVDTGEGIAAADLPFIFDRFWRADRARTHGGGASSGLGLSIANQLIKAHGGKIEVASQVGQGTTFTITLPAASHPA